MARVASGLALALLVATGCEEAAPVDGACGGEACEPEPERASRKDHLSPPCGGSTSR